MLKDFFHEFREFAVKGNVMDLAVGVVIGGAFGKITSSLVNDIIMPPIGILLGRIDFNNLYFDLSGHHYTTLADAKAAGDVTVNFGSFINNVIEFFIIALALFFVIKQINRLHRHPEKEPGEKQCPFCFTNIPYKATKCPNCTAKLEE